DGYGYSSSAARRIPPSITPRLATRLIQIPIPRPSAGSTESGIEMIPISTKTAARAPIPKMTRLSGMDGGSSNPNSGSATITSTARPRKKTSLPRTPLCQPITASFTPTPEPAYQPMNEERASTRPAIQVIRSPAAHTPPAPGLSEPDEPGPPDGLSM